MNLKKKHYELHEYAFSLAVSLLITVAIGLVISFFVIREERFHRPLLSVMSMNMTMISAFAYLIWSLVGGILSQQFLRFYMFAGLNRKEAFIRHWLYTLAATATMTVLLSLLSLPYMFMMHTSWFLWEIITVSWEIITVSFAAALTLQAAGQLFGIMALSISSKPVAGISIAVAALVYLNLIAEVYDESEGGMRFIILLIIAAILTAVNYFLYAEKHCAVKSTSIS